MIISKTPLRISFVGGGSDIESFYSKLGGAVVSTTIDKYVYVTVNKKFDNHIRVSYSQTEEVSQVDKIEHKLVRETLKFHKIKGSGDYLYSRYTIQRHGHGFFQFFWRRAFTLSVCL